MSESDFLRRKFFMHPAHSAVGVATTTLQEGLRIREAPPRDARALSVCLLSDAAAGKSRALLDVFAGFMESNYAVRCGKTWDGASPAVSSLDALEWCDCLLMFAQRMTLDTDQLQRIRRYCARGGAIVGLRSAGRALQQWPELDANIFGGNHRGECNNRSTEVNIADDHRDHILLNDVEPFISRCPLCKHGAIAADAKVLLTGTSYGRVEPVVWAREHNGGRIFYSSLGHPDDFYHPSFLQLLVNAISWTSQRPL